jgi:hypothetical protein
MTNSSNTCERGAVSFYSGGMANHFESSAEMLVRKGSFKAENLPTIHTIV